MPDRRIPRDDLMDLPVGAHFWFHFNIGNVETEWIKTSSTEARTVSANSAASGATHLLVNLARDMEPNNYWFIREEDDMTATLTTCPFPLPLEALETHEQIDALPIGSTIGYEQDDEEQTWTKTDRVWSCEDEHSHAGDFSVPDVIDGTPFRVLTIPMLTLEQMAELPLGSRVWVHRAGYGMYTKQPCSLHGNERCWANLNDHRNDHLFAVAPTYLVSRASAEQTEGQTEGQTEAETGVTIPAASARPGLYLLGPRGGGERLYVLSVVEDADYLEVLYQRNINTEIERIQRWDRESLGTAITVLAHDARLAAMLAWCVNHERAANTAAVEQARLTGHRTGVNERNAWWAMQMEEFNRAAQELAEQKDYCSDYDEFISNWAHIGLTPREREWEVTMDVTVRHIRTVTALDADAAWEIAENETGFREGDTHTLHGETVEITDISEQGTEEA